MTLTIIIAVVLLASTAGFLHHIDRKDARHVAQVADLCQRLQAPDTAVAQHVIGEVQTPSHIPFDDDEGFLKYAEEMVNAARA